MWLVPDEWHGTLMRGRFSYFPRIRRHRLHSQLNYSSLRERHAVAGRELVTIHPQDATTRGIVDGDTVRVWNHRGSVSARRYPEFRPGVVRIHEGAWPDS